MKKLITKFIIFCAFLAFTLAEDDYYYYDEYDYDTSVCPINEVSRNVTSCPPEETCDSYMSGIAYSCPAPDETTIYTEQCRCESGLIRNAKNQCVNPNECCNDRNAEIVECPNPCPGGTCDQPEFFPCRMRCPFRGCQCKQGFVKNASGKCIPLNRCPKKCTKKNQEFKSCGTKCPATCQKRNPICVKICVPGCFCKQGYILNNGECILVSKCPKKLALVDPVVTAA